MIRSLLILSLAAAVVSCSSTGVQPPLDVRSAMLASAQRGDPDFPDGEKVVLTHFSHVGDVLTSTGDVIHVADRRAVIGGMLSPRGRNAIALFDDEFRYLGKIGYVKSRPLWCDGGRLYLFGELDGIGTGLAGNVIDFGRGYDQRSSHYVSAYGSSGGIDD